MTRTRRQIWGGCWGTLKIAACLAMVSGCQPSDVAPPAAPPGVAGTTPTGYQTVTPAQLATVVTVCPQHDSIWVPAKSAALAWQRRATLVLSGTLTQIPEYHDCQRLLMPNGQYGPEAGVYADSAVVDLLDLAKSLENGSDPLKAVGVATIVSDGPYVKLWIERGINCLYLYTQSQKPKAFMQAVADGQDCARRVAVQSDKPLFVDEEPETTPFTKADFSPAARWDWDNRGNQKFQFIGLPCGSAYCLYGHPGAISSFRHDRQGMSTKARRVWRMRPWYDEQILGIMPSGGNDMVPSGVFGTVFPHPDLNDRSDMTYDNANPAYLLGAEIKLQAAIPQYFSKFGLEPAAQDSTNKVYLCKGPPSRCIPEGVSIPNCPAGTMDPWFAKIVSASGTTTRYRCVVRHLHQNFPIPGNARWWWDPKDEGIWMRCPNGCCQVT